MRPGQTENSGQARVYEVAKELGIDSKTALAKLQEMGGVR